MDALAEAYVKGIPLVFVVIGLVTLLGKLGVAGKAQLASAMGIGTALGVLYQISLGMPMDFAGWFGAVIYGLALGLTGAGIYETGLKVARKAVTAALEDWEATPITDDDEDLVG